MFFQTGIQEIERKGARFLDRIRLWIENRKLIKAETTLGLLGWQQVDYNSPELEAQVARIHETEKAQLELMNDRAGLTDLIAAVRSEMESSHQVFSAQIAQIESEMAPLKSKLTELSGRSTESQRIIARFKQGILDLQTQERDLSGIYKKLALESQSETLLEELSRNAQKRSVLSLIHI